MNDKIGIGPDAAFSALLEDNIEDLYDHAPCGNLSTLLDGTIVKINATLLGWLGLERDQLVGRRRFTDLLTVGGRIYHETHFAPLLQMQGEVGGIALDLRTSDGGRFPVLVSSVVRTGQDGQPQLIRTTVFDARDRRAYEQELLRARRVAEDGQERLRHVVAGLQHSLLPNDLPTPPGMRTAAYYHMASPDEVGGDFYDLFRLPGGRWGFFLGDVCGKGVEAAAVTAKARYTMRATAGHDPDPVAVLRTLNAALFEDYDSPAHRHCTVIFGVVTPDRDGCVVDLATGGHPPALLIRADRTVAYQSVTGGALIGILPDPPLAGRTLRLSPGDTLVLYSDGLTDAHTRDGRFGGAGLEAFLTDRPRTDAPAAVEAIIELLTTFADGVDDDVAVMALSVSSDG